MQPFDTKPENYASESRSRTLITVGSETDIEQGKCVAVELSNGNELALYNVGGEFYATSNFCPHKGALLSEGKLTGHIVECEWHGWQFDVRSGRCLTTSEPVESYPVVIENGLIKIYV